MSFKPRKSFQLLAFRSTYEFSEIKQSIIIDDSSSVDNWKYGHCLDQREFQNTHHLTHQRFCKTMWALLAHAIKAKAILNPKKGITSEEPKIYLDFISLFASDNFIFLKKYNHERERKNDSKNWGTEFFCVTLLPKFVCRLVFVC